MIGLSIKHGNFIKGGILSIRNRDFFRPQWFDMVYLRLLDRLVLMVPIMKDSPEANRIFKYILEVSGVNDFPKTEVDDKNNPFIALYNVLYKALKEPLPHIYFLRRVSVTGDMVYIRDDTEVE